MDRVEATAGRKNKQVHRRLARHEPRGGCENTPKGRQRGIRKRKKGDMDKVRQAGSIHAQVLDC